MEFLITFEDNKKCVYTYQDLIQYLKQHEPFVFKELCLKNNDIFNFFGEMVFNMINGVKFELKESGCSKKTFNIDRSSHICDLNSPEKIIEMTQTQDWELGIYTSGTTGKPKVVFHSREKLLRSVKTGEKFKRNVWAFAYNPTHMAGVQVFLQALLNLNKMIYIFRLPFDLIPKIIEKERVTHISATPTFYRNLIPHVISPIVSVKRITLGGEASDNDLISHLKSLFPSAKITNIYATTEFGTLFVSHGEWFKVKDEYKNLIRIDKITNELMVHRSLIGNFESDNIEGEWYRTGDIVEYNPEAMEIRFVARKDEMINVGGYKVNPNKVESIIRSIDKRIIDVRVYGKKNPVTGKIIVADIVIDKDKTSKDKLEMERELLRKLKDILEPWEMPRVIRIVKSIPHTRTLKKKKVIEKEENNG